MGTLVQSQPKGIGALGREGHAARVRETMVPFPRWESLRGPGCRVDMTLSRGVERSVGEGVCAGVCCCEL